MSAQRPWAKTNRCARHQQPVRTHGQGLRRRGSSCTTLTTRTAGKESIHLERPVLDRLVTTGLQPHQRQRLRIRSTISGVTMGRLLTPWRARRSAARRTFSLGIRRLRRRQPDALHVAGEMHRSGSQVLMAALRCGSSVDRSRAPCRAWCLHGPCQLGRRSCRRVDGQCRGRCRAHGLCAGGLRPARPGCPLARSLSGGLWRARHARHQHLKTRQRVIHSASSPAPAVTHR